MVEFKPLRGVHGHELHGVARFLLEVDRSAGLLEIIQVLDKFLEALRFALGLPFAHKLSEAVKIFSVFRRNGGVDLQGLGEFVEQFGRGQTAGLLSQFGNQFGQFVQVAIATGKGRLALRREHRVPQRHALAFRGALGETHQVRGLQAPRRHRQHPRASDIVRRLIDQPEIGDQVPDQTVRKDREILDDEWNLAGLEHFHQFVAVRVTPIQHGEGAPLGSGAMQPLDFAGHPLRFGDVRRVRDDPHLVAVVAHGRERVLRNIDRFFIVADRLARDAQDSSGRAVVQRERPQQFGAPGRGPRGEAIQKNREASEGRPAEAVNGLPVIADHHQVGTFSAQLPEQFELGDVRVLEFIDQNVTIARAKFFAQRIVLAEPQDGVHDLRAET